MGSWSKGIGVLISSDTKEHSLLPFSLTFSLLPILMLMHRGQAMWELGEKTAFCKLRRKALPDRNSTEILILDFQPPELWEISFCCLNHPVYCILFWQPEQTKIPLYSAVETTVECFISVGGTGHGYWWRISTHWSSEENNSQVMQTHHVNISYYAAGFI